MEFRIIFLLFASICLHGWSVSVMASNTDILEDYASRELLLCASDTPTEVIDIIAEKIQKVHAEMKLEELREKLPKNSILVEYHEGVSSGEIAYAILIPLKMARANIEVNRNKPCPGFLAVSFTVPDDLDRAVNLNVITIKKNPEDIRLKIIDLRSNKDRPHKD